MRIDKLDVALLKKLLTDPKGGMRAYARELDVARGTVQSRISRLERLGVIRTFAPTLSPAALGFPVQAFLTLHLAQGQLDKVSAALKGVPEVIEAHVITGDGDLMCRVVARDTLQLQEVIQRVIAIQGIVRTKSEVALSEQVPLRTAPLLGLIDVE